MATRAERLARIRAIQNPDKATEEVLAYLSTLVKPVEVDIPLPVKGEDYFTQQDINDIADIVRGMIKDGVDGKDGEKGEKGDIGPQGERGEVGPKGQKGEDGKDGQSPNVDDLIKNVLKKIPKANPDEIVKLVLNKIELPDTKELISKTELVDFLKRGGFRGGGISSVAHDNSLSGDGTASSPLSVVGDLSESFETVSSNLSAYNSTLNYNGSGDVTSIVYSNGVTKTFNYTGTDITSIVLSGSTPSGITLTKTLTYTDGDVTGIAYS